MKILILGGYGTFGGRLAKLLAGESRLTLLIAGRSEEKALAFCNGLDAGAQRLPVLFDRDGDVGRQLHAIAPDIVVDATGPFQAYGDDPYRVVKACLALNIHYMDLADGSDFVNGIVQFDAQAKSRGIFVLSGVSSFPVLTAAVVRELSKGLTRITAVKAGIAPSPYAGVGLNVIRAIAGYSGKPLPLIRNGRKSKGYALADSMRYTVSPPGRLPLRNIRFSLVDVPDNQLLPEAFPGLETMWVGAGPTPEILLRMLNALAWLVRWRLLPTLLPLAPLFYFVINLLRWGEHRGGMFVEIDGINANGSKVSRSWHMVAERDDGPLIPSMAVEAVIRNDLKGRRPERGARAALKELDLADYDALFEGREIYTGRRESFSGNVSIYRGILGDAMDRLPASLRVVHDFKGSLEMKGVATVERGKGILPRIICALMGFPKPGDNIPVSVQFQAQNGREIWKRTFAGRSFSSIQEERKGRSERLAGSQDMLSTHPLLNSYVQLVSLVFPIELYVQKSNFGDMARLNSAIVWPALPVYYALIWMWLRKSQGKYDAPLFRVPPSLDWGDRVLIGVVSPVWLFLGIATPFVARGQDTRLVHFGTSHIQLAIFGALLPIACAASGVAWGLASLKKAIWGRL